MDIHSLCRIEPDKEIFNQVGHLHKRRRGKDYLAGPLLFDNYMGGAKDPNFLLGYYLMNREFMDVFEHLGLVPSPLDCKLLKKGDHISVIYDLLDIPRPAVNFLPFENLLGLHQTQVVAF